MMKYLRIYKTLLLMNLSALVVYRGNFFNSIIASIAWGLFSLFSIVLLTSRTPMVFSWRREELLLLNGVYGIIIGVFHTVFSRNFERFSMIIHLGQLDGFLTKPVDAQFLLTFWLFNYASLSRMLIAIAYTWYIAQILNIVFSPVQILAFGMLMVVSLILLYSIWFTILTITIWFTRLSNLIELMFSLTGMARYPQEMFYQLTNYVFLFLLPLTLIMTLPTKLFLERLQLMELLGLLSLAIVFVLFSRKFWKFALRYYTSASS